MNVELSQSVVLTSFGNAYLHASNPRGIADALIDHNAFEHVTTIQFGNANADACLVAFRKWMASLKRRDIDRFWVTDEHNIMTDHHGEYELWRPEWDASRRSNWRVRYHRCRSESPPSDVNVAATRRKIRNAVKDARDFAATAGLTTWVEWFTKELAQFGNGDDVFNRLPQFGYDRSAKRLLIGSISVGYAAESWGRNVGFSKKKEQQKCYMVSNELDDAVRRGIVTATNAFDSTHQGT